MKSIAVSLSPNAEKEDILLAIKLIFSPWKFFRGVEVNRLELWFRQYFVVSHAIPFNSGRSALYIILKALGVGRGDEVILQAFTCVAVPNAVITLGAKPIYVDIADNFTMDVKDLERKITNSTKVIIVQHTFGIPSNLSAIVKLAKKKKIAIVEDCAHIIGGLYDNKKFGLFGKVSFFSFGRDKAFSSVFGGMALTKDRKLGEKIRSLQRQLPAPSYFWILQQLLHPIIFSIILPLYDILSIGKIILVICQRLHLLSFPVSKTEKEGRVGFKSIKKFPNALACLVLLQLKKIDKFNKTREDISRLYIEKLKGEQIIIPYKRVIPFLRFPILVDNRDQIIAFLRKKKIYLGIWYSEVIDPKGVDFKKVFYQRGSCPKAEFLAKKIINLPTYPTMTNNQIKRVVEELKNYFTYVKS